MSATSISGKETYHQSSGNTRRDKKEFIDALATEAETAAGQRNMKRLIDKTITMTGKRQNQPRTRRAGTRAKARWAEHFREILNRPLPTVMPDVNDTERLPLNVGTHPPSKAEIVTVVKQLKNGKASGPDGIPPKALTDSILLSLQICYIHFLLRSEK